MNLTTAFDFGSAPSGNQCLVTADPVSPQSEIVLGDICLRLSCREVTCGEEVVKLKKTSFLLLALLARHPEQIVTRKQIFKEVWDYEFDTHTKRIEVQVHYLRRMLLSLGSSVCVKTHYGTGLSLMGAAPGMR